MNDRMRFGVLLLSAQFPGRTHTQVLDGTVATAVAAEHAGFDDVWIAGPRTRPRPDVIVAATSTGTVELAAKHRLPLLLGMHADDTEKAAMVDHYAAVAGDADVPHVSAGLAHVADSDDEAGAADDPEDPAAQGQSGRRPVRPRCTGAPISAPRPVVRAARDGRRRRS